jgi:DNA-binding NtrC family response regulator
MATAIMVISPQETFRISLERLLQQNGYTLCQGIREIAAFRHAINASEPQPTVILLDYCLSRSISIDFIRSLKKQGFAVILMGTHFLGKDVAQMEQICFLEKPFTQRELHKAIQTVGPKSGLNGD